MTTRPEWAGFTVIDGRTASGRRIPIKTGVVTLNGKEHFAIAVDDAPPVLVEVEDGKRLATNIYTGLYELTKQHRS